jgi:GT2 family glycosyltransferase
MVMVMYIAVVSHGHGALIERLNCLSTLVKENKFKVWVLDNVGEDDLSLYCKKNNINYLKNKKKKGFGENNNLIFSEIDSKVGFSDSDRFLVLNPDIVVSSEMLLSLLKIMDNEKAKISTCNLFTDNNYSTYDNSIREFPTLWDFFSSFILKKNPSIMDKSQINKPCFVNWAAGSFLCFDVSHYKNLAGFDIGYFMYCEDIDICFRSSHYFNEEVLYCPQVKAIHLAQHANRNIFSKDFLWHIQSMMRFLLKRLISS